MGYVAGSIERATRWNEREHYRLVQISCRRCSVVDLAWSARPTSKVD